MNTYFISDLHLCENEPERTQLFFDFLEKYAANAEALYILGDFFEYWIGDDVTSPFHERIASKLAQLTQNGTQLFFMPGNRDFLVGKQFLNRCQCAYLPDPSIITIGQQTILLAHGDAYCTDDKNYQRFRKCIRHPITKNILTHLPKLYRHRLASKLRLKSQSASKLKSDNIMDVNLNTIKAILQNYQTNFLIHGHTHRPGIDLIQKQGQWLHKITLSDWVSQAHALRVDTDLNYELQYL